MTDTDRYTVKIGIIGDPQYVDSDDGHDFEKTTVRRYRQSLKTLGKAVEYFDSHNVDIRVIVGDLLDASVRRLFNLNMMTFSMCFVLGEKA